MCLQVAQCVMFETSFFDILPGGFTGLWREGAQNASCCTPPTCDTQKILGCLCISLFLRLTDIDFKRREGYHI